MSQEPSGHDRARYSSTFAAMAAVSLLAFVVAMLRHVMSSEYWSLWFILLWAAMLAFGLIIWAARPLRAPLGGHRIGSTTLGMVAGVAAGAIAAVALALQVASTLDQTKSIKEQNTLMREQVEATRSLEAEFQRIREALGSSTREGAGATKDGKAPSVAPGRQ
jgi:hypothetical protein